MAIQMAPCDTYSLCGMSSSGSATTGAGSSASVSSSARQSSGNRHGHLLPWGGSIVPPFPVAPGAGEQAEKKVLRPARCALIRFYVFPRHTGTKGEHTNTRTHTHTHADTHNKPVGCGRFMVYLSSFTTGTPTSMSSLPPSPSPSPQQPPPSFNTRAHCSLVR